MWTVIGLVSIVVGVIVIIAVLRRDKHNIHTPHKFYVESRERQHSYYLHMVVTAPKEQVHSGRFDPTSFGILLHNNLWMKCSNYSGTDLFQNGKLGVVLDEIKAELVGPTGEVTISLIHIEDAPLHVWGEDKPDVPGPPKPPASTQASGGHMGWGPKG
ncbi:MAG: hypothetical protein PHS53_03355 [Candidatus Pacebacteria bacterium]|nr:hypothetical protein [Candidatus Paceibacterota bacterium]MDD5357153.1 hypothetical protein [Candidatus Paceibacterota bacterium]